MVKLLAYSRTEERRHDPTGSRKEKETCIMEGQGT